MSRITMIPPSREDIEAAFGERRETHCPRCGTRIDYHANALRHTTLEQIHADCHVCKMGWAR